MCLTFEVFEDLSNFMMNYTANRSMSFDTFKEVIYTCNKYKLFDESCVDHEGKPLFHMASMIDHQRLFGLLLKLNKHCNVIRDRKNMGRVCIRLCCI